MKKTKYANRIVIMLFPFIVWQCSLSFPLVSPDPARIGAKTNITKQLASLPVPKEKIVATVYKFRDQSGQYKSIENGTSWSTAITQGATSILMKALEESNWFVVIEREGLSNLLNERKIIRSSKANYQTPNVPDDQSLPPLLYAGVILEGGIISYDTNIRTGGIGLKYFGAGGSNQYREDRITVYLRAIATVNGRVLTTVYTSKTILSQMVDVGFYRFVTFKKLLEAETGFSYNEPADICVKEAIEKSVVSLVMQGILQNLWKPADSSAVSTVAMNEYLKEKEVDENYDVYNNQIANRNGFGIGLGCGLQLFSGDCANSIYKPSAQVDIKIPIRNDLGLMVNYTKGEIGASQYFNSLFSSMELCLNYKFLPDNVACPFISFGVGVSTFNNRNGNTTNASNSNWIPQVITGLGLEYQLFRKVGLNASVENHYYLSDNLDGIKTGRYNDFYWGGRIGLTYYFH